jgi:hypothetical protein
MIDIEKLRANGRTLTVFRDKNGHYIRIRTHDAIKAIRDLVDHYTLEAPSREYEHITLDRLDPEWLVLPCDVEDCKARKYRKDLKKRAIALRKQREIERDIAVLEKEIEEGE